MSPYPLRLAGLYLVAIVAVLSCARDSVWGADEYVAPPQAEREAVAALVAKGASVRVDGSYRVYGVSMTRNCTNDDLKLLAACEKLTELQLTSASQITDAGMEHLKSLPNLKSILFASSGVTEAGIAALRAASPNLRITNFGGTRGAPGGPPPVPGGTATRGTATSGTFGGPSGFSAVPSSPASLAANPAVQDDLKLTPEQRQQIRTAQDMTALLRARDEKVTAVLTDEQRLRLKQIELQQGGATALARTEIAKELRLSDDQRTAIRKAIDETIASVNEANSGLRQGPVTADSFAKLRERTAELNKQRDEKIQALLNDEQRQAWLAMQGPKGPVITASFGPGSFGGQSAPTGPVRSTTLPAGVRGKPADDVGMKFIDSGVTATVGGYMPLRAEMNLAADSVKKAPEGLEAAKYGALKLGKKSWTFILDEPEGKPAKLYVDTDGDGDLTNDPATTWAGRKSNNLTQYSGTGKVDLGGGSIGSINMYRFDPADAQRATLKNTLMFYPDYGYELMLTLDDKQFTTAVPGEGAMPLWVDRDGNKQRSSKTETVRLGSPFNFTGTTYVLNRDGDAFKLEKPSVSLPIAPLPPNLAVGQKAIPFEMAALDGTKIDFPKSYAGKLVMLDFWATWCGPCIAELPNVKKAYTDWHDKGFEILGISFDNANMDEKVKAFLKEYDLPWSQIYEGKGWTTTLGEKYEVTSIPFVLLVDGDSGEIVATVNDLRGPGLSDFIGKQLAKKNGKAISSAARPAAADQGNSGRRNAIPVESASTTANPVKQDASPAVVSPDKLPSTVAHFRFNGNGQDEQPAKAVWELKNTEFRDNALFINGIYDLGPTKSEGYRAVCKTPDLNYAAFTVAMRFKAEEFDSKKNNLLTGGTSYRWFCLHRSRDGNLTVSLNNRRFSHEIKDAPIEAGKWTTVACGVDVPSRQIVTYVNGKKVAEIDLPQDFKLDIADSEAKNRDRVWTFSNYSNASVFHGLVDELVIYGKLLSPQEFEKLPLQLSSEGNSVPTESTQTNTDAANNKIAPAAGLLAEKLLRDLKRDGAFGFPQAQAQVLCDQQDLRVSIWSNSEYLFVQAIVWADDNNAIGDTPDGRKIGDYSSLMLDVDADQKATPQVDRHYTLNPWPTMLGLRYQVVINERATTGLQSNSIGRGSIKFVEGTDGKKTRVDSFVIPLAEIGKQPGEAIRLAYYASSPEPKRVFNSIGFERSSSYYSHALPKDKYHEVTLVKSAAFDPKLVPEGREDTVSVPDRNVNPVPKVGVEPPEVTAADWINIETTPTLANLRGNVVLVEFWATWCGPCVAGIPHLNELHDKYTSQGLRILSFTDQSRQGIESFLKDTPMKYAIGTGSNLAAEYGVQGIPHTFLIGKDGKLIWQGHALNDEFHKLLDVALASP